MNQRPSGYEPDELPDCSIPQQRIHCKHQQKFLDSLLVRKGGLEPPRPKALPPQGSVSTNSTTTAAVTHSSSLHTKLKGLISKKELFRCGWRSFTRICLSRSCCLRTSLYCFQSISIGSLLFRKHSKRDTGNKEQCR